LQYKNGNPDFFHYLCPYKDNIKEERIHHSSDEKACLLIMMIRFAGEYNIDHGRGYQYKQNAPFKIKGSSVIQYFITGDQSAGKTLMIRVK
jgi:hypothetical protein